MEAEKEREIRVSRVIGAPREKVFEAMMDPKQVGQWWGPNGFKSTIHEMNARPGRRGAREPKHLS